MRLSEFDYHLPPERIAQTPVEPRDAAQLLVMDRANGAMSHRHFRDIPDYLRPGDLLVCNNSRVIPARLFGHKESTGGKVEVFLLRSRSERVWEALVRGRVQPRTRIVVRSDADDSLEVGCRIVETLASGGRLVEFDEDVEPLLDRLGHVPLPPYIHRPLTCPERYQTIYARVQGSVAAPTAGLHFTPDLVERLQTQGVDFAFATLHIGLDTFRPVQVEEVEKHLIHAEWVSLDDVIVEQLRKTRAAGGRIVAVGTTVVRTLETAAQQAQEHGAEMLPYEGWTRLFITPGYRFRWVDALVTNFHLPRSTLLMLVSAFAGLEQVRSIYQEAVAREYRFYSFGDAMLIL